MAVVSVAIVISFHLKSRPSPIERRIAFPLGLVFWLLSLACLASGFANYIKTVTKYSRRQALVQSGWKTQIVSTLCVLGSGSMRGGNLRFYGEDEDEHGDEDFADVYSLGQVFTIVTCTIVAACVLFLSTSAQTQKQ